MMERDDKESDVKEHDDKETGQKDADEDANKVAAEAVEKSDKTTLVEGDAKESEIKGNVAKNVDKKATANVSENEDADHPTLANHIPSDEVIKIIVTTLAGKKIAMVVESEATILALKAKIQEQRRVPIYQQFGAMFSPPSEITL